MPKVIITVFAQFASAYLREPFFVSVTMHVSSTNPEVLLLNMHMQVLRCPLIFPLPTVCLDISNSNTYRDSYHAHFIPS